MVGILLLLETVIQKRQLVDSEVLQFLLPAHFIFCHQNFVSCDFLCDQESCDLCEKCCFIYHIVSFFVQPYISCNYLLGCDTESNVEPDQH